MTLEDQPSSVRPDCDHKDEAHDLETTENQKIDDCAEKHTLQHLLQVEQTVVIEADGTLQSIEHVEEVGLSQDKEKTEQYSSDSYPKAPDGGYAWIPCFGVFLIHMVYGGLNRAEGLFFLQFQSRFQTGAQLAAWPGSLMSTLHLFMGPVCGALTNRYSMRTVTIIGSLFCFAGYLLNGFAPNIYFLFLSHTLLMGFGRGLLSPFLVINMYFDKHRSLANGLATSGVGLGSLWVVPLTQLFFDTYGFQGAFLILSTFALNGLVSAMMFRPLSMHMTFTKAQRKRNEVVLNQEEGLSLTSPDTKNVLHTEIGQGESLVKLPLDSGTQMINAEHSNTKLAEEVADITKTDSHINFEDASGDSGPSQSEVQIIPTSTLPALRQRKDNWLKSSLKIIFPLEHSRKERSKKAHSFRWDLFKHFPFMVFCCSNLLFILSFRTCFTFIPAIAMSKGLTKTEAALLLTVSGALDTFGRMALGFIMDLKPMRPFRPYAFNILLYIIAAAALLIPSLQSFGAYVFVCAVYGFSTGAFISQKLIVLVDILGRDVVPSSLGIQKLFQGFGTLIGPPLAGALRDALGSYDGSFYLSGGCMIGSGLLMVVSLILLKIRKRKNSRT